VVIFDLDGTLLDVWERYFTVFNSWWNIKGLSIQTYIKLKRELSEDILIVRSFGIDVPLSEYHRYREYKHEKLEAPEYLELDKEIVNWDKLKKLDFIVLTIRRRAEALYQELRRRKLDFLIHKIFVLEPGNKLAKLNWVSRNYTHSDEIYVVGDSETDLLVGKIPGVKVVLVNTGLQDPAKLVEKYRNEIAAQIMVLESVNDFLEYIMKK